MSIDLLAVALGRHTTPHSTIALGCARAQLIGGHLLGDKALRHGWWERKWVPLARVWTVEHSPVFEDEIIQGDEVTELGSTVGWRRINIKTGNETVPKRTLKPKTSGPGRVGGPRIVFGWRRMATDGLRWWDSDFPDRSDRERMVRQHLAAAVQGVRDATGYDVITEAELPDCASVLCPASWHGLLLCKRVLEIAAVPTRREQEAAE